KRVRPPLASDPPAVATAAMKANELPAILITENTISSVDIRRISACAPSSSGCPISARSTALTLSLRCGYLPLAPTLPAATRDPGSAWIRAARGGEYRAPRPPVAFPNRATEPYRPIRYEATRRRAPTAGPPANRGGGRISCDEVGSAGSWTTGRQ